MFNLRHFKTVFKTFSKFGNWEVSDSLRKKQFQEMVGCIGEERGEEKRRPYYSEERKVMDKAEVEVMR